jgi:hypothetical protein
MYNVLKVKYKVASKMAISRGVAFILFEKIKANKSTKTKASAFAFKIKAKKKQSMLLLNFYLSFLLIRLC